MALTDYALESKTDLAALAEAIRTKTGNAGTLTVPQMKTAVDSIEAGGGNDGRAAAFASDTGIGSITAEDLKGATKIASYAFYNRWSLTGSVTIPDTVKNIYSSAFQISQFFTSLDLGNGVETIGQYAFGTCKGLTSVIIPASVSKIENSAFYNSTGLNSVTFKGTPSSIGSSVFGACGALVDIYVPWAEGAVANAPWGATNATIHYDSEV